MRAAHDTGDLTPDRVGHTGRVLRVDSRGTRLQKEHKGSARKIDLAVAMVMAVDRAGWWHANGEPDYDVLSSFY